MSSKRRYVTPVIVVGAIVKCEIRGLVKIVGLTGAPIPWPIGERDGEHDLIVYKGLAKALQMEPPEWIAGQLGVSLERVAEWQQRLSIRPRTNQPSRIVKRRRLPPAGRKFRRGYGWRADEDEALRTLPPADAARKLGRTLNAVYLRRSRLDPKKQKQ